MTPLPRPLLVRLSVAALVVALIGIPLGGLAGLGPLAGLAGARAQPSAGATGSPGSSPVAVGSTAPSPSPSPVPSPSPTPSPTPTPIPPVALAPVTAFRSTASETNPAEVQAVLAGTSKAYAALELVAAEADAVLAAVGAARPQNPVRLVLAADAAALRNDLAAHPDRLGILRADDVDASVRALAWNDASLFGVGRVASLAAWPLTARLVGGTAATGAPAASTDPGASAATAAPAASAVLSYDPAAAWTLFAGGDILLDRGVSLTVKSAGKGVDFPFGGGTATITSRYCCSSFGWQLPRTSRTGNAGALRALLGGADIAIANFENPAPVKYAWHKSGTVFTADPALIAGLKNAGLDWLSLANNHIRDAGATGILQTITALDGYGIAHGGAGSGYAAAHKPTLLTASGVRVALLGYDTIAASYWATTADKVGSAQMTEAALKADVAAARAAGADVVIVFPHWGVEYTTAVSAQQKRLGHAAIDAGADLVIGNHPHWAGAVELYKGKPIWYALGNFVFDQTWSEPTMEGITLELTFHGARLVQAKMRPHIILDKAQPNFMEPAAAGKIVMDQVLNASKSLLPW